MSPGQPLSRKTVADKQKSANLMQASKKETCQKRLEQIHFCSQGTNEVSAAIKENKALCRGIEPRFRA